MQQPHTGTRLLSYSEVSRALDCWAAWDFAYGDTLAGSSLEPKQTAPILSQGRAWGAAVQAWHSNAGDVRAGDVAVDALCESLDQDAAKQKPLGIYRHDEHEAMRDRLLSVFTHYANTAEPFAIEPSVEFELNVPIPSRTGKRPSSRYRLLAFIDGWERDDDGRGVWLHEFKLRGTLTPVALIQMSRQVRWYAWAWERWFDQPVYGIKVHERWNEAPRPARLVQGRKKGEDKVPSHAKDQLTTADAYLAACEEHDVTFDPDTLAMLKQRRWQQSTTLILRESEKVEAGTELVTAARLIHQLDSGALYPLRNVKRSNCNGCRFREICPAPDEALVDEFFSRVPPKRERPPIE